MPRGIPSKKRQTNGEQISKMDAMRHAVAELGYEVMPGDYQKLIKSKFGIDMSTDMISSYKSSLRKEAPKKSALIRTVRAGATGGITLEDIKAVKALADKIGAEKVKQLAEVLGK